MSIHVDVLNAETNAWVAGDVVKVNGAKGTVTTRIVVPDSAAGVPLKYNSYLAPSNEQWPNILAESAFDIEQGAKVIDACAPVKNTAHNIADKPDFNYVVLAEYPGALVAGARTPISVQYNYQDDAPAAITTSLVRNSDNYVIAQVTKEVEKGEHTVKVPLDVPREVGPDAVHLTANLVPVGKDAATDSVAEDRAWSTSIMYQRLRKN